MRAAPHSFIDNDSELDLEHCPSCGGGLKIIVAILRGEPGRKRS